MESERGVGTAQRAPQAPSPASALQGGTGLRAPRGF